MSGLAGSAAMLLLAAGVAGIWICVVGMLRAGDAFDRLHLPGAATMAGPPAIAGAILIAEGASGTSLRALLIFAVLFLTGGIVTHATARAEWLRRRSAEAAHEQGKGAPADADA
jgi:monovalent cation/proton antiporter MnhG/PhaG subunit